MRTPGPLLADRCGHPGPWPRQWLKRVDWERSAHSSCKRYAGQPISAWLTTSRSTRSAYLQHVSSRAKRSELQKRWTGQQECTVNGGGITRKSIVSCDTYGRVARRVAGTARAGRLLDHAEYMPRSSLAKVFRAARRVWLRLLRTADTGSRRRPVWRDRSLRWSGCRAWAGQAPCTSRSALRQGSAIWFGAVSARRSTPRPTQLCGRVA
jgi:hypothetical protein